MLQVYVAVIYTSQLIPDSYSGNVDFRPRTVKIVFYYNNGLILWS